MVDDDSIKLAQLEDIKATWDPTNTFHHCQVIASKPVGFYQSLLRNALNSNNNNLVLSASISNPGKKGDIQLYVAFFSDGDNNNRKLKSKTYGALVQI